MSNKANASRYGGAAHTPSMGGGGGGTSLLDILSGSTKKQLQDSAQTHETSFQQMMNDHEKAILNLQADLASRLAKEQAVIEMAKQHGVTPEDFANQLSGKITANKMQELQNQNDANNPSKNPNIAGANQIGANSKAAMSGGLPPQAIIPPTVQQGATGGYATVPGLGMNEVRGSTVNQGVTIGGGFPMTDPKTGQTYMAGQTMLPTQHNTPGGIFPGPMQITQQMLEQLRNGQSNGQPGLPDNAYDYFNSVAPQGNANPNISNSMKGNPPPPGDNTQPSQPSQQQGPPTVPQQNNPTGFIPDMGRMGRNVGADAYNNSIGPLLHRLYQNLWSGGTNQYQPIPFKGPQGEDY